MAHDSDLPCDGEGRCMICKINPPEEEKITCKTCVTPWHVTCLSVRPQTLADAAQWECPDCSNLISSDAPPSTIASGSAPSDALVAAIRAIESDASLSDQEKAKKRQQLLSGKGSDDGDDKTTGAGKETAAGGSGGHDVLKLLSGSFNCSFCMQLPERPVTTPCGHNFCLKCFEKWVGQGKRTCAICRTSIPPKMASNPRINSSLVIAIRMAKMTKSNAGSGPPKAYYSVLNQNKPDKAYTTERAKKTGKANACSGKIFVTVPPDHFGPITAENDPERGMGVMVGETWEDRMECRQWGAHLPHVAGISGQSDYGAQSVALSGGYEDDEDHGEWFLYTGSGGRDLSGNKRTNKTQSFDQKFDKSNEALRVSCKKGYPVRVVRSHKEKRSAYAPETGVRYDGVYRIEKCWRKPGIQGFKVCRYLFVRCDNDPAPWTSDETGDRPRPFPVIKELKEATDITERKSPPSWDYDEEKACWMWKIPPPESRRRADTGDAADGKTPRVVRRKTQMMSVSERLLKEFCCLICHKVMNLPLTTPCAHNFCKSCLENAFAGQTFIKERNCEGRRTLRAQKNIMKCPTCSNDISEYLQNPQVNRELMSVIESLQRQTKETEENAASEEEMVDTDEKNDDVKEEEKDEKVETEVEHMSAEGDATFDPVNEDNKETDQNESIAKSLPKVSKNMEVNNEVKDVNSDADVVFDPVKEAVKDSDAKEPLAKPTPKANKKRKAGVTDNAPNKKLHEEAKILAGDGINDTGNGNQDSSLNLEVTESKDLGVAEVGKGGKKTSKQKKDIDAKCSAPASPGARTRSKKSDDIIDSTGNDNKDATLKSEVTLSKDSSELEKASKKASKQKKDVDVKCLAPVSPGARTRSKKAL
uniref:E3 ubiquitin-protein ligase ORTHRUS 2-like n=1 Tax=Erigeron canadensis TaxID=72917 RepID=UPI001CB8F255|nr:E3 ubiquitin-protein ligase ORTHRUS 2-like [Erigeron canadensis]